MNRPIRLVGLVMSLMVFALLANLTYFVVGREPALAADPANQRAVQADFDRQRGQILAASTVIAETAPAAAGGAFSRQRVYPNGPLYAPVTGYYSYVYGSRGLEHSFDKELAGTAADQWWQRLADTLAGRTPVGATVQTTIDPVLQQLAAEKLGDAKGAVVVLDPSTGAVRALVSSPSYDPNKLASHDFAAVEAAWSDLLADPGKPLSNRAARETYPPGSTAKLVVAAAALAAGYSPDSLIDTPATVQLPNSSSVLPNASACGNSQQTLANALRLSCNTSFALLGNQLGAEALRNQAEKFGFNRTHLDAIGDAASVYLARPDDKGDITPVEPDQAQLMMSSIGQWEIAASPLQMALVAAAIANDGVLMEPYLVSEIRAPNLNVLYSHEPQPSQAMEPADAQALQEMMLGVVASGTGTRAQLAGTAVGGKTGTAEWQPGQPPYAWFTAYAHDPDVVVAVFIESAGGEASDTAAGQLTGPIVRDLIAATR
ncbi:MAG: penicillin-binding protein 2 [Propionibacteriaceae bacterium]|jgi:peptidoglycan glycosyltransferase|nr:penicillin-binding protein 2 [Propionibacteriaceae bacterium]